jgi:hypothetical protein
MSQAPKPDKKPKYNNNDPFVWVDSQWEKFMTQQKEHKAQIKQLQYDLATCTENFQKQRKDLESLVARVPSHYLTNIEYPYNTEFGDGKTPEEMHKIDEENKYIYESPDGGETVYRREFGNYENKELYGDENIDKDYEEWVKKDKAIVEDNFDINDIKEKAPIIGEMMEHVNQSEEDILRQKLLNSEMANAELKDILRNMGVSI